MSQEKFCVICKKPLSGKRRDAKTCSAACRAELHRVKQELEPYNEPIEGKKIIYFDDVLGELNENEVQVLKLVRQNRVLDVIFFLVTHFNWMDDKIARLKHAKLWRNRRPFILSLNRNIPEGI